MEGHDGVNSWRSAVIRTIGALGAESSAADSSAASESDLDSSQSALKDLWNFLYSCHILIVAHNEFS